MKRSRPQEVPIEELDSALRHLVLALEGNHPNDIAWWLCANHAKFLVDHFNINRQPIINMAKKAGEPPTGADWDLWFDRVEKL